MVNTLVSGHPLSKPGSGENASLEMLEHTCFVFIILFITYSDGSGLLMPGPVRSALAARKLCIRQKTVGGRDGIEEGNEAALVRVVSSAFSFPMV